MKFISTPLPLDVQRKLDQIGEINLQKSRAWQDAMEETCKKFSCMPNDLDENKDAGASFVKKIRASKLFTELEIQEMQR